MIERVYASGVGLTIGSIGRYTVNNVTFRDVTMHHTVKGIYVKFRQGVDKTAGLISNVLYENVFIDKPSSWPIWIGPAQQDIKEGTGPYKPCHGNFFNFLIKIYMFQLRFMYEIITFKYD